MTPSPDDYARADKYAHLYAERFPGTNKELDNLARCYIATRKELAEALANDPPSGVVGLVPEGIELAEVRAIPSPSQWHPWFQARLIDRQRLVNNDNPWMLRYWLGEGRDVESAVIDAATKTGRTVK